MNPTENPEEEIPSGCKVEYNDETGEVKLSDECQGMSPTEIYQASMKERSDPDPLKQRQACEKSWLAVVEAVDEYLERNNMRVKRGTAIAHQQRRKYLGKLAEKNPEAKKIFKIFGMVENYLHGYCFYMGIDDESNTEIMKKDIVELLKMTGAIVNPREEVITSSLRK